MLNPFNGSRNEPSIHPSDASCHRIESGQREQRAELCRGIAKCGGQKISQMVVVVDGKRVMVLPKGAKPLNELQDAATEWERNATILQKTTTNATLEAASYRGFLAHRTPYASFRVFGSPLLYRSVAFCNEITLRFQAPPITTRLVPEVKSAQFSHGMM
jgi:hypothetical protein